MEKVLIHRLFWQTAFKCWNRQSEGEGGYSSVFMKLAEIRTAIMLPVTVICKFFPADRLLENDRFQRSGVRDGNVGDSPFVPSLGASACSAFACR